MSENDPSSEKPKSVTNWASARDRIIRFASNIVAFERTVDRLARYTPQTSSPPPLLRHHPACPGGPLARRLANALVKEFRRFWITDRHWIARMKRAMTTEKRSKPSQIA